MGSAVTAGSRFALVATALAATTGCLRHSSRPVTESAPAPPLTAMSAAAAVASAGTQDSQPTQAAALTQQGASVASDEGGPKNTGVAAATAAPAGPTPASRDSVLVSTTEVRRRAVEVFGDSASVDPKAATDSVNDSASVEGPTWDLDVRSYESTDRVEHYVHYFSGPARERIQARLERGTRYEPMIRQMMRNGGLPEDMYYLALIESGFDPNAYSRAAAVGMWQFMTSTARDMGMRVDWWLDERRDPVRSTRAAVRFIRGLKEQFGSLYLAAAAYNGGPGRISRGLSRYADDLGGTSGDDLFFALAEKDYLKHETKEYVPQLIAAAIIAKEPERYGMQITPLPPFEYDSVRVGPATPLMAIAKASGTKLSDIRELNPQILRGLTPPRDSFQVRIPPGTAADFADALAALPESDRVGLKSRTTKKGQYLSDIAAAVGLSEHQLSEFNPKAKHYKSGRLVPGQTLLVPSEAVAEAAVNVPDPSIERYSSSRATRLHVVRSGENLSVIAKRYHTTTKTLMKLNGLRRALIFPGQSLVVAGSAKAASARAASAKARSRKPSAKSAKAGMSKSKSPKGKKTTVAKKPTVAKKARIAKKATLTKK